MRKFVAIVLAAASLVSAAQAAPICLSSYRIRSTNAPDEKHIIFHMIDGTSWKNTLKHQCAGITFNGFVYEPFAGQSVCENLQTIQVLDTGSVCLLGQFTKEPPKKA
jgi:hypothetical protein